MVVNIFAYSDKGCVLAQKIAKYYDNANCYAVERLAVKHNIIPVETTAKKVAEVFRTSQLLVFVGACGIAVRSIAPHIKSKVIDPACVVVDDCGKFAIPILAGHLGGANEYCQLIAKKIGATPVVTTATDINKRFSVDTFARKNDLHITSMPNAMKISAGILQRDLPISFCDEIKLKNKPKKGVYLSETGYLGVHINYKKVKPYELTLNLVPKILTVGIGCRKDTPRENIETLFLQVLGDNQINIKAVRAVASIDLKQNEKGLLDFCKQYKLPVSFYSAKELQSVKGEFTKSNFVKGITGVENVCERSAVKDSNKGEIIVKKTCLNGVTIAIAVSKKEIYFE